MSLACTKQFSLTIASTSDVYACYPCDEPDGAAALVDKVSGFNMRWVNLPTISVPGQIGTAVRVGFKALSTQQFSNPFIGTDSHWDLSASSFTMRFWINIFYDVTTIHNTTFLQIWSGDGAYVYLKNSDLAIHFAVDLDGVTADVTGPPVTMPGWHRIVAWHEKGVGLGLKVDNGATTLLANTGSQVSKPRAILATGGGTGNATYEYIDDIAIWKRKLTDAEMLNDWNDGVGKSCSDSLPDWKLDNPPYGTRLFSYSSQLQIASSVSPFSPLVGTYTYQIVGGAIPIPLSLSSSGLISGTPTEVFDPSLESIKPIPGFSFAWLNAKIYTFTVRVTRTSPGPVISKDFPLSFWYIMAVRITGKITYPAGVTSVWDDANIVAGYPVANFGNAIDVTRFAQAELPITPADPGSATFVFGTLWISMSCDYGNNARDQLVIDGSGTPGTWTAYCRGNVFVGGVGTPFNLQGGPYAGVPVGPLSLVDVSGIGLTCNFTTS